MSGTKSKYSRRNGLLPGAPIYTGGKDFDPVMGQAWYNDQQCVVKPVIHLSEFKPKAGNDKYWLHVKGLNQAEEIAALGKRLKLHPLLIEDILNTNHQPKVEEFDNCVLVILKYFIPSANDFPDMEQISLVLADNYVLSFQEINCPLFSNIHQALIDNTGKIRQKGSDYLFTLLLDHVVDSYLPEVDKTEQMLVEMEDHVMSSEKDMDIREVILRNRKRYQALKKPIVPLKESYSRLLRLDNDLVHQATKTYLRDVFDHISFVSQSIDSYHDMLIGLMNMYMSNNDLRMNLIMKRLTMVSTVFIPLSLLAGIWGMNFENTPGFKWEYGYPVAITIIVTLGITIWVFLKKKMS